MIETTEKKPLFAVDKETLVPLGLLIAVVLAATAGTWQLAVALHSFQSTQSSRDQEFALKFQKIELQLQQLQQALASEGSGRWNRTDMREWAANLRASNPNITIPEIVK
jgi:hypothetical protein